MDVYTWRHDLVNEHAGLSFPYILIHNPQVWIQFSMLEVSSFNDWEPELLACKLVLELVLQLGFVMLSPV
jgi:hypothetical protein